MASGSDYGSSIIVVAPGSELFVVYSDGRNTQIGDRFPGLQNRTFVVKATRLFRF